MGKRELVALLIRSFWCLVIVVWLLLAVPWVCLQFVIFVFSDSTMNNNLRTKTVKSLMVNILVFQQVNAL